ncbi:MAG: enolase C-terminal domain-like protein [Thermoguttaceae bacterium]|jgi:O-succinylbenzoate synthase
MHIERIDLFHVGLPLKQPAQIAFRRQEVLQTVVVRMAGGGAVGWGEAGPGNAPLASGEWAGGVLAVLRDWLAPAVAGATIDSPEDLQQRLAQFRGNLCAKAALDTAWWDLQARLEGRPLHDLLDGHRAAVEVGPTFDRMPSGDEFLAGIGHALQAGFARVKLIFRPGWDVEMLRAVRREFPAQTFHIDCQAALGLEHMEMLCRLDDFCLAMIEQPLPADDLVGHAMVQETVRTPIGLDEGVTTPAQAEMALDLKSGQWVSLTPGKVGGLTPARAIHDACQAGGVSCWVGAMPQSAVGARFELALAAKANCRYPADFFPSDEVLARDLAEPLRPARDPADGVLRVPLWTTPGIGVEPDPACLEQSTLQQASLRG